MSKTQTGWRNLDLTTDELERFTKAFQSEEFRKLFAEYCNEISDPNNRRIYEEELIKLESERGIDVKFVRAEPGFVIKAIDGNQKIFINVAKSPTVDKPTSECGYDEKSKQKGLNWYLPYVQSKPKPDFDKNQILCTVYDVIFHPDTLHLATKNKSFKKLVIETACDAVRATYNCKFTNEQLKFPKLAYKGTAVPVVLRKSSKQNDQENHNIVIENAKKNSNDEYVKPKYEIIHKSISQYHELTNESDAKLNITVPNELKINVHLPLLDSSKDIVLDVNTKSIYLHCDTPAKYKLQVCLPFDVDKEIGNAQFDSQTKTLTITLPVLKRKLGILDLCREDSGVESDHHSPKLDNSLDDDVFKNTVVNYTATDLNDTTVTTCVQQINENDSFLESTINYILPQFTFNRFENIIAFTLHVKNVEADSIVAIETSNVYRLKFSSIGTGFFQNYYAFYLSIPNGNGEICKPARVEAWDNNVIVQIELNSIERFNSYKIGLHEFDCKEFLCNPKSIRDQKHHVYNANEKNDVHVDTKLTSNELKIEITNKTNTKCDKMQMSQNVKKSKRDKKLRSLSESRCDELRDAFDTNVHVFKQTKAILDAPKLRTYSESSNEDHHLDLFPLKGILKRHSSYDRTTPECSLDEHGSDSIDLGIGSFKCIPEEKDTELSESVKKTVRFDKHLCRKLLFKMNSTVIGQRKPKENKRKKKNRKKERSYSEGEASDYENHVSLNKKQYQGRKNLTIAPNSNGASETKNNMIFDIEI